MSLNFIIKRLNIWSNIVIDSYLNQINRKHLNNKKSSITEWFLFSLFFVHIFKDILCIYLSDQIIRLYLCDLTLFVGGVRQFYSYIFINGFVMVAVIFMYYQLSDPKQLKLIFKPLEVVRGRVDPDTLIITRYFKSINKVRRYVRYWYGFILFTGIVTSK